MECWRFLEILEMCFVTRVYTSLTHSLRTVSNPTLRFDHKYIFRNFDRPKIESKNRQLRFSTEFTGAKNPTWWYACRQRALTSSLGLGSEIGSFRKERDLLGFFWYGASKNDAILVGSHTAEAVRTLFALSTFCSSHFCLKHVLHVMMFNDEWPVTFVLFAYILRQI